MNLVNEVGGKKTEMGTMHKEVDMKERNQIGEGMIFCLSATATIPEKNKCIYVF